MVAKRTSSRPPAAPDPEPGGGLASEAPAYAINTGREGRVAAAAPLYNVASATSTVSATEAARHFSDLVSRACYQGETFVIERGGRALCQLGPLQARRCSGRDLLALLASLPHPDEEFLDLVEAATRSQATVEPSPWEK
ncbi:MAG: type II toxin-antitoxin system Phd/YefM family antitoxin [Candidatus Binatia bacterium]